MPWEVLKLRYIGHREDVFRTKVGRSYPEDDEMYCVLPGIWKERRSEYEMQLKYGDDYRN